MPQKELKDIITFLNFLANIYVAFVFKMLFSVIFQIRKGLTPVSAEVISHGGHSGAQRKPVSRNRQGAAGSAEARLSVGNTVSPGL